MNKIINLVAILCITVTQFASALDPIITAWKKCNGTNYNGITGNVRAVYYNSAYVWTNAASVPDYSIGPWTANPNTPSDQNYTLMYPITVKKATTRTKVGLGKIGQWINGVSIYNADDGQTYNNLGYWSRNAYFWEGISFDSCVGHAAQNGEYHHHLYPKCIYPNLNSASHSPLLGFAFDGVPIYGPYGYNDPNNASSPIVRIRTSFRIRNITARTSYANGTTLTGIQVGPTINSTYPLGAYLDDFEYVSGYGHLDDSNGRWGITPEYPNGVYAYFTTMDANGTAEYPFVLGLYYYGVPQTSGNTGPNSGRNTVPSTATTYYTCTSSSITMNGTTTYTNGTSVTARSSTVSIYYRLSLFNTIVIMLTSLFLKNIF